MRGRCPLKENIKIRWRKKVVHRKNFEKKISNQENLKI